jgi:hypothetical protein
VSDPSRKDAAVSGTDPWLPNDPAKLLVADPTRREPISFQSDGNRLAGHLYRPPKAAPGSEARDRHDRSGASVKEQTLPQYGEASPTPATRCSHSTRVGSARAVASRASTTTRG